MYNVNEKSYKADISPAIVIITLINPTKGNSQDDAQLAFQTTTIK